MADRILTLLREMLPAGGATPGMTDELREKLEQYESRLREVHDIANRQAADITELRSVAEVQAAQVRGAEKLSTSARPGCARAGRRRVAQLAAGDEKAAAAAAAAAAPPAREMRTMSKQSSSGSDEWHDASEGSGATPPSASEIAKMQEVLSQAAAQQQAALAEGSSHLKQLAVELQTQAAAQAETQAAEWRAVLQEASSSNKLLVDQLQAQLAAAAADKARLEAELKEKEKETRRRAASPVRLPPPAAPLPAPSAPPAAALAPQLRAAHAALRTMRSDLVTLRGAASEALRDGAVAAATDAAGVAAGVSALESRVIGLNVARREACNKLQEARGAIRVLCRCRPLSAAEAADGESSAVVLPSHGGISVSSDPISAYNSAPLDFKFDATFGVTASTRQVYEELSPAVASVLQVNGRAANANTTTATTSTSTHLLLHLPRCCRANTSA